MPSAVAIGAKLVSPPLFQSMYSRSRYSCSGTANGRSRSCTKPRSRSASRRGGAACRAGSRTTSARRCGQNAVVTTRVYGGAPRPIVTSGTCRPAVPARGSIGGVGRRLAGKVAFVTGSTRGIGRAIAPRFAAEGAAVVVTGRTETPGTRCRRRSAPRAARPPTCTPTWRGEADVEHAVAAAVRALRRAHDARQQRGADRPRGPGPRRPSLAEITDDAWDSIMTVALKPSGACTRDPASGGGQTARRS